MSNRYKREVDSDVIGIYSGNDELGRNSLLIKLKEKPQVFFESIALVSEVRQRRDRKWTLQVSLKDNNYLGVFRVLIRDLVSVVSDESNQIIAERKLINRYSEWECLFEQAINLKIGKKQIQGLIGELYFLYYELIPHIGVERAVKSWIGPDSGNRDFQMEETWLEIKTKSNNKNSVVISNENQLMSTQIGYLVVITVEESNDLNKASHNLLSLHNLIMNQIYDKYVEAFYLEKLAKVNFIPSEIYAEESFEIKQIKYYIVDNEFPRVIIPNDGSITGVKYELNLSRIINFEREENEWKNIKKN